MYYVLLRTSPLISPFHRKRGQMLAHSHRVWRERLPLRPQGLERGRRSSITPPPPQKVLAHAARKEEAIFCQTSESFLGGSSRERERERGEREVARVMKKKRKFSTSFIVWKKNPFSSSRLHPYNSSFTIELSACLLPKFALLDG